VHVGVGVEDKRENGQGRVDRRVTKHQETVVDWDRNEVEQNDEDCLDDGDDETTMEYELSKDGTATVR